MKATRRDFVDAEAARQTVVAAFRDQNMGVGTLTEEVESAIFGGATLPTEHIPGDASEASLADILALGKKPQKFPLGNKNAWVHRLTPAGVTFINRKAASEMRALLHIKDEGARAIEAETRLKLWKMVYCLRKTDDPDSTPVIQDAEVTTLRNHGVSGIVDQVSNIVDSMELDGTVLPEVALAFFGVTERLLIACDFLLRAGRSPSAFELMAALISSISGIMQQGYLTKKTSEELIESVLDLIEQASEAKMELDAAETTETTEVLN